MPVRELALADPRLRDRRLQRGLDRVGLPRHGLHCFDRSRHALRRVGVQLGLRRVGPQEVEILDRLRELVQPRLQRGRRLAQRAHMDLGHERLQALCELVDAQLANVFAVDPVDLLPVEAGARVLHSVEGKKAHQLIEREQLLFRTRIPAQQREVVDQRLGQITELAEEPKVALGVFALGELRPVGREDQWHVRVRLGALVAKCVDEHQLVGSVRQVLFAADHV